jgi:hypothetical protein
VIAQGILGSRYPIAEGGIAKALNAVGVSVDISQVHLPAHVSAATAAPELEIVTAEPLGNDQVRLQLRCHAASECLPFLATVDVKDPDSVAVTARPKIASANSPGHQTTLQASTSRKDGSQLRAGSRAVMEIRDGRMDIYLPVLAIDTGTIDQQVRVCTLDRKKVFHAIVTGEGRVEGVME